MKQKLIEEESRKMLQTFNEEFFIPYLEKLNPEMDESTNIVLSFACSAFLSTVIPILSTGSDPKKAIDDANGILNDMRLMIQKTIKANSVGNKVIN